MTETLLEEIKGTDEHGKKEWLILITFGTRDQGDILRII